MTPSQIYAQKLLDPRWQKKKSHIMLRDNFTCQACKDEKTTLNVHHLSYDPSGDPWSVPDDQLITYCHACHLLVEDLKKHNCQLVCLKKLEDTAGKVKIFAIWIFQGHRVSAIYTYYKEDKQLVFGISLREESITELYKLYEYSKTIK